jgi:hypothetical protein
VGEERRGGVTGDLSSKDDLHERGLLYSFISEGSKLHRKYLQLGKFS